MDSMVEERKKVEMWALQKKIPTEALHVLFDLGFESMEAVSCLAKEDLAKSKLPVGITKLILKAVRQTFQQETADNATPPSSRNTTTAATQQPSSQEDAVRTGPTEDTDFINEVLGNIQRARSTAHTDPGQPINLAGGYSWQDPQVHLKSLASGNQDQFLDITDHVFPGNNLQTERVVSESGDFQFVYKSGPQKPKIENISLSQWSTANLAILHKLVEGGVLPIEQVFDYLSHTTRIYRLISSHDMVSVFLYDREYRRLQHVHKFRWGTAVNHISEEFLRLRSKPASQSAKNEKKSAFPKGQQHPKYVNFTTDGIEICRKFNSKLGCQNQTCKYGHVCSVPGCCSPGHSRLNHVSKN